MFRKLIAMMLCVLLVLCIAGCSKEEQEPTTHAHQPPQKTEPSVYPPMVMIDGTLYVDQKLEAKDASIEESQIAGRITFTIKNTAKPRRNNEANYARAHNAPYARWNDETYGEVYVIQYSGKWYILQPAESAES